MHKLFIFLLVLTVSLSFLSYGVTYGGGDGTKTNPYQIWTAEQMNTIGANSYDWTKNFKLMADIDMSEYTGTQYCIIGNSTTKFTGTFNGNGYVIRNLTYTTTLAVDYVGLFGWIENAFIQNLGIRNTSFASGGRNVGGLAGRNYRSTVTACYTTGSVSGVQYVGGLIGFNYEGALVSCYSASTTSGDSYIGGLVGRQYTGSISACYATGAASGSSYVGGLIGRNYQGKVICCYATGKLTAAFSYGGICGDVTIGGGYEDSGNIWNTETSGTTASAMGTGKTTIQMKTISTYLEAGWDFSYSDGDRADWWMPEDDYPRIKFPVYVMTPEVVGMTQIEAEAVINSTGFNVGIITTAYNNSVQAGNIISQWPPAGTHADIGTLIDMTVSLGPDYGECSVNFGGGENQFTIEFVTIDDAYNEADSTGFGTVCYNYYIGKYEITNDQWNAFTVAVGAPIGNPSIAYDQNAVHIASAQPTNCVSWFEAAQFCNYLTSGDKSKGVYVFSGNNANPGDFIGINRNAALATYGTIYCLPTEDEWYKAAYYKADATGYSIYANGTSIAPIPGVDTNYNYWQVLDHPWDAGTGKQEENGTFDMMGNVWELTETFKNISDAIRRGGSYFDPGISDSPASYIRIDVPITDEVYDVGFRIVSITGPVKYSGGSGTEMDPYQIANIGDFQQLSTTPADWDKSFILTANIDLSELTFTQAPIAPDIDNTDTNHEGTSFTGIFDGNGHVISNLAIIALTKDYIGLFGNVDSGGQICNLGVVNVNIIGRDRVGGLMGRNNAGGSLTSCYVIGSISGVGEDVGCVGGIVGELEGVVSITSCYTAGSVTGTRFVGGLVGVNSACTLISCRTTSSVGGRDYVGGLVGANHGFIKICYATGSVNGTNNFIGGLVGNNGSNGTITTCYSSGAVSGNDSTGGLVGANVFDQSITSCFWDIQSSGLIISDGGIGITTIEMKTISTFILAGWDFTYSDGDIPDWWMPDGDYPSFFSGHHWSGSGTEADPYIIGNAFDLNYLMNMPIDWDKHFILMANIDFSNYKGLSLFPIGVYSGWEDPNNVPFTGVFNGNGKTISNYTYASDQPQECVGAFGYLSGGGQIKNLILKNITINTPQSSYVGGIVGYNEGCDISGCFVTGLINARDSVGGIVGYNWEGTILNCGSQMNLAGDSYIGGIVGYNYTGLVSRCYFQGQIMGDTIGGVIGSNEEKSSLAESFSMGTLQGYSFIGGLVGSNYSSTIDNSYSVSDVRGDMIVGGLVGCNAFDSEIIDCYSGGRVVGNYSIGGLVGLANSAFTTMSFWDNQASGQAESDGGIGKTHLEMQSAETFAEAGWVFDLGQEGEPAPMWKIRDGLSYPRLIWQQESEYDTVGDYGVNLQEYERLSMWWLNNNCDVSNAFCEGTDFDKSGEVGLVDLSIFMNHWMELKANIVSP